MDPEANRLSPAFTSRKKLNIEDLPYIFDECDKLDTQSLKALETSAQIITTKVNDIEHNKLTLTAKKGK